MTAKKSWCLKVLVTRQGAPRTPTRHLELGLQLVGLPREKAHETAGVLVAVRRRQPGHDGPATAVTINISMHVTASQAILPTDLYSLNSAAATGVQWLSTSKARQNNMSDLPLLRAA